MTTGESGRGDNAVSANLLLLYCKLKSSEVAGSPVKLDRSAAACVRLTASDGMMNGCGGARLNCFPIIQIFSHIRRILL